MKHATCRFGEPQRRLKAGRRVYLVALCTILAAWFMAPKVSLAQLYTGSLSGEVKDPTGAVVTKAQITLKDVEKGISHQTATDASGHYEFRSLPSNGLQPVCCGSGL